MTSVLEGFPSQMLSITFFCPILILQKEPVFTFKCRVLNKLLVLSLNSLWIEPGTFRTLPLGYQVGNELTT